MTGRRWPAGLLLVVVLFAAALLRLYGNGWLAGAGHAPDFSFHPDDQRFIEAARVLPDPPDLAGYVLGMPAQLFITRVFAEKAGLDVGLLTLQRLITLAYALATVVLVYAISMRWRPDRRAALLAAAFVALAPLHVLNSNFGTADVAAVALFYAVLYAVLRYFRSGREGWFVLTVALTGVALAVKFFLPLAAGLGLLLLLEPRERRFARATSAALMGLGAFAAASLFLYTPRDFVALLRMLLFDNVVIAEAKTPLQNLVLYVWELATALGLPVALVVATVALAWLARGALPAARRLVADVRTDGLGALRRADRFAAVMLGAHALLILVAGIHAARHNLVFVPWLALVAAHGIVRIVDRRRVPIAAGAAGLAVLFAYLGWNAVGVQRLYRDDLRLQALHWVDEARDRGLTVRSVSFYTPVRGTVYDPDFDLWRLAPDEAVLTCDLAYMRYLRAEEADDIFHPKGGQQRMDFYRAALLDGRNVRILRHARQRTWTVEQDLIARGWLGPLQTFTPGACALLGRDEAGLTAADQDAARRELVGSRYL